MKKAKATQKVVKLAQADLQRLPASRCYVQGLAGCCGADELYNLECALVDVRIPVAKAYELCSGNLIIFTDVVDYERGSRLAKYIRSQKLGKVTSSSIVKNDNSGNNIQAWVWAVDYVALDRWAKVNME
jgi:hypothetical protein